MMADPQNREPAIRKLFESAGTAVNEVLYSVSRGEIIVDVEGDAASVGRAPVPPPSAARRAKEERGVLARTSKGCGRSCPPPRTIHHLPKARG